MRIRWFNIIVLSLAVAALQLLLAGDILAKVKKVPRNRTFISVGGGGEALQQFTDFFPDGFKAESEDLAGGTCMHRTYIGF